MSSNTDFNNLNNESKKQMKRCIELYKKLEATNDKEVAFSLSVYFNSILQNPEEPKSKEIIESGLLNPFLANSVELSEKEMLSIYDEVFKNPIFSFYTENIDEHLARFFKQAFETSNVQLAKQPSVQDISRYEYYNSLINPIHMDSIIRALLNTDKSVILKQEEYVTNYLIDLLGMKLQIGEMPAPLSGYKLIALPETIYGDDIARCFDTNRRTIYIVPSNFFMFYNTGVSVDAYNLHKRFKEYVNSNVIKFIIVQNKIEKDDDIFYSLDSVSEEEKEEMFTFLSPELSREEEAECMYDFMDEYFQVRSYPVKLTLKQQDNYVKILGSLIDQKKHLARKKKTVTGLLRELFNMQYVDAVMNGEEQIKLKHIVSSFSKSELYTKEAMYQTFKQKTPQCKIIQFPGYYQRNNEDNK